MNYIFITLIIALLIQTFFFLIAYRVKTDKFTDFTYGLTFVIISAYLLNSSPHFNYQVITFLMILFWGARISCFLFFRVLILKKDKRFDDYRNDFKKFAKFWFFQGLSVWIIMVPSTLVLTQKEYSVFGVLGFIGFLVWLTGLTIETASDLQKFFYKNKHKNRWVNVGFWKYARHPNYFGEMLVWWGIWILGIPHFNGFEFFTILGPIYISLLLLKFTGIPVLDKKYREDYKDNAEFKKYYESTNLLVPIPRKYFKDSSVKF